MSKFEIVPGRGRRTWAVILALLGIAALVLSDRASSRVNAAIMLLAAWELAFVPTLPFNLTLREIYQKARQGWRMSLMSRVIGFVTIALIILAIYLQLHGR
jgi:hypothetical protein